MTNDGDGAYGRYSPEAEVRAAHERARAEVHQDGRNGPLEKLADLALWVITKGSIRRLRRRSSQEKVMTERKASSAQHLREMLRLNDSALAMYQTEAQYHVQIDYTCQLLDVVDEVTDPVTAGLITDLIYERLTGDGMSAAAQRQRDAHERLEALMRMGMPPHLTGKPTTIPEQGE